MDIIEENQLFWDKVDTYGVCWEWIAGKTGRGYGQFKTGHKNIPAHKYSYALLVGPVPEGKQLDHLCRNRACVCPDHLEIVTNRENVLRGSGVTAQNARKTHCLRNHPFDGDNLRISVRDGSRACKQCERDRRVIRQQQKNNHG